MKLEAINKNLIRVQEANSQELEQLKLILTKKIENWRFHPLVKKKIWDGTISKLQRNEFFSFGLWHYVKSMMNEYGFNDIEFQGVKDYFDFSIDFKEFEKFCLDLMEGHEITPYDFQIETAFKFLRFKSASAELATSSGKTLVAWLFYRKLYDINPDTQMLMIVPRTDLVSQGEADFHDYNQGKISLKVQEIYSAAKQIRGKPNITIGTYQSLVRKPKEFFENFNAVICDESHMAPAKSIIEIFKKLGHTDYKIGVSGTLPKVTSIDYLTLMELTGPTINKVTVKDLEEKGRSTPVKIKVVRLNYLQKDIRELLYQKYNLGPDERAECYQKEKELSIEHPKKIKLIAKVVSKTTKNSLVLFGRRVLGQALYKEIKEISKNKEVFYIDGSVDDATRKMIKQKMKTGKNRILVASFQIFSTGISIKNLHSIFLTDSYKSEIIIRQTIGRGIRLLEGKKFVTIIDFVDDYRYPYTNKSGEQRIWKNYLYRQSLDRIKIYEEQNFEYEIKSFKM